MFDDSILLKKEGLRSDKLWAHRLLYRTILKRIPVWLDTHVLLKSQFWPKERIDALQDDRINVLLKDAARVPFWSHHFKSAGIDPLIYNGRDALARLPIIAKKDLIGSYGERAILDTHVGYWQDFTSGSTGQPFRFFHDTHFSLRSFGICERMIRTAGGGVRFPFVTARARPRPGLLISGGEFFFLGGYNSVKHRLPLLRAVLQKYRSTAILQAFSSPLIEIARLVEESGQRLPIHAALATGEGLSDIQRKNIERALGVPLFMAYVTRELGWLGFECEHHHMHLNEEWAYVEIVDKNGNPLSPGAEGRIVVTTFDNRATYFIRYDSGDRGVIGASPCRCGRTLRTIQVVGRTVTLIELPDGQKRSLLQVAGAFDEFWGAVRHYQILQHAPELFTIKIVPGPGYAHAHARLEEKLIRALHPQVSIQWQLVEEIAEAPSGKALYFVRSSDKS